MNKLIEFDSGFKLVYAGNDAVRSVAIGVFVSAGVGYETETEGGISHFIEHMVFKGTATRSAFDIVNETDSIGAQINAYTAKTHTLFYTTSLAENAEKCVDILADMYFNPKFDPKDLVNERKVVYEEINEGEDDPSDVCLENLSTLFYKGNSLEKPILGYKKTLKTFKPTDLRAYMARRYTPANTVLVISGNLSEAECVSLAENYFECRMTAVPSQGKTVLCATKHEKAVSVARKKDISQAHIAFAFPSVPYGDPRRFTVNTLCSVFSSEMSSRLFQNVREKLGLCYTVTGYPSMYENNGSYVLYAAVTPEKVDAAVKAIADETRKLVDKGITEEELKKGKQQQKTGLVLGQESTSAIMRAMGRYAVQTGKLYDIDDNLKRIDEITCEDVLAVSREIFDFDRVAASLVTKNVDTDLLKLVK